jgi:putative ATP-dependent endonuclease of OLD family
LTQIGKPGVICSTPAGDDGLDDREIADLERYLDATKSNLLYARKVILVEGPAELFLIPPLVKKMKGIELERHGISVIPIYGVHFNVYAKLFGEEMLPKKCAIVADGDLKPSDGDSKLEGEDELDTPPDLDALENDYVHVYRCATTFERAVTMEGTLEMFACAADDIGAVLVAKKLRGGKAALAEDGLSDEQRREILKPLRASVLSTAKRFGKARFSQIAARHVDKAEQLPKYISNAVEWLLEE